MISIIIPVYNCVQYIAETLESIFCQDYPHYEVIIVDDGSTDNTYHVLEPYHERIRYIYQENAGVSAARNHGLRLARGEYIVFVDGDDILLPAKLVEQVKLLDKEPSLGGVHSGWQLIDWKGELLDTVEPWHTAPKLTLKTWLLEKPVFLGSMMIRRNWLEQVDGFDMTLSQAEDVDLIFRLVLKGCRMAWLYKPTASYRQHSHNTVRNGQVQAENLSRVVDKFFRQPNLPYLVLRLENRARYYTLMWIVWKLYRTGYPDGIVTYLRQSLICTRYPPFFTVLLWIEQLVHHSFVDNVEFRFHDFKPHFKRLIEMDESLWEEIERLLQWWANVWRHYPECQYDKAVQGLYLYRNSPVRYLLHLTCSGELISPTPATTKVIDRFWQDITRGMSISGFKNYEVTILYLTVFGKAILDRRWQETFRAFGRILQYGFHPKAVGVWLRFIRLTLIYLWGRPERF